MAAQQFDVFLAHNSIDKPLVRIIAEELKQFKIKAWVDEEQILPGEYFQDSIQKAISKVNSAAICIGRSGLGRWQKNELRALISQCSIRQIPVIPVLLPGVDEIPEESNFIFLKEINWIKFERRLDDQKTLLKLAQGITSNNNLETSPLLSEELEDSSNYNLHDQKQFLYELQKSKQTTILQLSDSIAELQQYIEILIKQKASIETSLAQIEQNINSIESRLSETKNQSFLDASGWLRDRKKHLSKNTGNYILGKYSAETFSEPQFRALLFWRLEKIIEIIQHYLLSDGLDVLSLIEEGQLFDSNTTSDVIFSAIEHMKVRIDKQNFSEDIKLTISNACNDIQEAFRFLEKPS